MTSEQKARQNIDRLLGESACILQDRDRMNIFGSGGVLVLESRLKYGYVDYALYAESTVIGVIEAKSEGHTLKGVEIQSAKYTSGLPDTLPRSRLPLPFAYGSIWIDMQSINSKEPDCPCRRVFKFLRPDELIRLTNATMMKADSKDCPSGESCRQSKDQSSMPNRVLQGEL